MNLRRLDLTMEERVSLLGAGVVVCADGLAFAIRCRCGAHEGPGRMHDAKPLDPDSVEAMVR